MHMLSRKDLNSAESAETETVRISKSPTTVVTTSDAVLTKEEATVYVRELDLFLTAMLLEDTPPDLSLGKLCEDHGYNFHCTNGEKSHFTENDRRLNCNTANYVLVVVLDLSTSSSISTSPTSPTFHRRKA